MTLNDLPYLTLHTFISIIVIMKLYPYLYLKKCIYILLIIINSIYFDRTEQQLTYNGECHWFTQTRDARIDDDPCIDSPRSALAISRNGLLSCNVDLRKGWPKLDHETKYLGSLFNSPWQKAAIKFFFSPIGMYTICAH